MVDFIPPAAGAEPKMVLQAFENTLWTARSQGAMTMYEIRWIMKAVIIGVWTIHRQELVCSGTIYLLQLSPDQLCHRFKDGEHHAKWI